MRQLSYAPVARLALWLSFSSSLLLANSPPDRPVILEPAEGAHAVDPRDVHMATAPFNDPDPGDSHAGSDWELRDSTGHLLWYAYGATGPLAVHIHLGDGHFTGSHLAGNAAYELRVRFRDSSGDDATQWSDWATRQFSTGAASGVFPLQMQDVLDLPAPRLHDANGAPLTLFPSSSIALLSASGGLLLSFQQQGTTNPPPLPDHGTVKVRVSSGEAMTLPPFNVDFSDDAGVPHTVYLPAVVLPGAGAVEFWIAQDGSSFSAPAFTGLARAADMPWRFAEGGFVLERVAGGLKLPVNIAFVPRPLPDADAPLFYITELYGTIRAVLRDGTMRTYATGLLNFNPTGAFPGSGEHGTVGTVVEPDTGDLLVATVVEEPSLEHHPRVIRIHSNDGGRTGAGVTTVLDMPGEEIGPSHQISSLSIGPDGKLYVHIGDGFHTELATDLHSFRGKILRMNLDGTAPPDNPFYDQANGITATDYVYAYGFRNPFGGAWRAADRSLYEVENGPGVDRLARVVPGMNYRWAGSDEDMRTGAAYNWEVSVAPVNIAFVQGATFDGSGFPPNLLDHAFVSESGPTFVPGVVETGKRIREFVFDSQGKLLSTRPFLEYTGTGFATVAALAAGPDGLYFSDLFPDQGDATEHDAHVYRIRHVGGVTILAAEVEGARRSVQFVPNITLPSPSYISWDFGDGTKSNDDNPIHTFSGDGPYDVHVTVIGAQSVRAEASKRVQFAPSAGTGLAAIYDDADGHELSRIDPQVDFDWSTDAPLPGNTLNVTWTGVVVPSVSGRYVLQLQTDGEGTLRLDGQTIIDKHGRDGPDSEPTDLEAGHRYTRVVACQNTSMLGSTQLLWVPDGLAPRVIPQSAFYPIIERRRAAGH